MYKKIWIDCLNTEPLSLVQQAIGDWRVDKGFTTGKGNIPEKLMLIVSEVSEAMEEYRDSRLETVYEGEKPVGFATELADVFIRLCDLCDALGIDLAAEVARKMAYNEIRPYMHGRQC